MKIEDILISKKVSDHLYHLQPNIEPEDLLKILRFIAPQGRELGGMYDHQPILCTNVNSITKQEFDYIYANTEKNFESWLDGFTREEIVNRVGSATKIISSTTKTEIVRQLARDKDLLFRFFKKKFIEKYCSKWYEFKRDKEFLAAVSDNTKSLVFKTGCKHNLLSTNIYLQYWQLKLKYGDRDLELDEFFKTGIIDDNLAINLKDRDDCVIKNIQRFVKSQAKDAEFEIEHLGRGIDEDDLEFKKAEAIEYSLDLHALAECFGLRKASKFKTFSEGLRKREKSEVVNDYLNRRFLITSSYHNIYCGIPHNKDLFEKLAWHLKIEYLKDQKILCKISEDETSETISALWEILTEDKRRHSFCFVEI